MSTSAMPNRPEEASVEEAVDVEVIEEAEAEEDAVSFAVSSEAAVMASVVDAAAVMAVRSTSRTRTLSLAWEDHSVARIPLLLF